VSALASPAPAHGWREIEPLMLDGFIIAYRVDVPVKLVMIVEVDDVE
jgi:hypothetical protein